jgi:NitT/TauT family transport system ATP-binding protein
MKTRNTGAALLTVNNLSASFKNGYAPLHVLDDISFDVYQGQYVCILGPSGSGKSTLMRILAGLLPFTEGDIQFAGKALTGTPPSVGMVFQKSSLMPWRTVQQNITLPMELHNQPESLAQKAAQDMIELVGLTGFENALPRDLSGGMAQRVAIARTLVQDPELLLLDEPFGALDALTRERLGEELLRIWNLRQMTVIMVTHDITEAIYLADRVIVISDRPAHIKLDLDVRLARPRREEMRYTPEFGEMARQLRAAIG